MTIIVGKYDHVDRAIVSSFLLYRVDETQKDRNSRPRLQVLVFSLGTIMSLSR